MTSAELKRLALDLAALIIAAIVFAKLLPLLS